MKAAVKPQSRACSSQIFSITRQKPPRIRVGEPLVGDGAAGAHLVREGLGGQHLLGREVAVQGGGADPGAPGDLPHRRVQAFRGEHRAGGVEDQLAVVPGVGAQGVRQTVGHALTLAKRTAASVSVCGNARPGARCPDRSRRPQSKETTLKAVAIKAFGSPEGLAVIDLPDPAPADGQVLIVTEAIGVGGVDTMIQSGALAAYGFREGHILGGEIAGTVAAVGDGVDTSWVGQRVWAFTGVGGGYVEQAIAPAETLIPLPANVSAVDAVTLGSSGAVGHFGLSHAHFIPGESVLVRGAAGGIGIMTVQLAARGGASAVAVTTSSAGRGDRLRKLGATHVLDRAGEGGEDAPAGYDVIIDIVAGPDLPSFFAKLKPNGRMVAVGAVAGNPPANFAMEMFTAFHKSMSFATFSAATVTESDRRAVTAELFAAAGRGELHAVVHELLPLEQAGLAHQKMAAGEVFGRIALESSAKLAVLR